jgi:hypothetical protein
MLRRLRSLSRDERALLCRAFAAVLSLRVALWVLPFSTVRGWTERAASRRSRVLGDGPGAIVWAVEAAARRIPDASCLTRALAGWYLLARAGDRAEVRVGVRRASAGQGIEAHAWLVRQGRVIIGGDDLEGYRELGSI